mmetsp:Transcript_36916/g.73033  ORF Transcript_36916/g.73033 Transcript_36916/m.73033 type:complete len:251 (+) Transcript_36916:63-815(+)
MGCSSSVPALPADVEDALRAGNDPPPDVQNRFAGVKEISAWDGDVLHPALSLASGDVAVFSYMEGRLADPHSLKFFWKLDSFNGYRLGTTFANLNVCSTGGMLGSTIYQITNSADRLVVNFLKKGGRLWWILAPSDHDKSKPLFTLSKATRNFMGGSSVWQLHKYDKAKSAAGPEILYVVNLGEPNSIVRYFYRSKAGASADDSRQQFIAMSAPHGHHGSLVVRGEVDAALVLAANSIIDTADTRDRAYS